MEGYAEELVIAGSSSDSSFSFASLSWSASANVSGGGIVSANMKISESTL